MKSNLTSLPARREIAGLPPSYQGNQLAVYRTSEDLPRSDARTGEGVFQAIRFSVGVAVAAVAFLAVAAVWVGTCGESTFDTVACGAPQLTLLALGAPLILLAGGLRAFVKTYRISRRHGLSWPWQVAGWFLMAAMLLVLAKSVPSIALT